MVLLILLLLLLLDDDANEGAGDDVEIEPSLFLSRFFDFIAGENVDMAGYVMDEDVGCGSIITVVLIVVLHIARIKISCFVSRLYYNGSNVLKVLCEAELYEVMSGCEFQLAFSFSSPHRTAPITNKALYS
jgi:hypothetical protein